MSGMPSARCLVALALIVFVAVSALARSDEQPLTAKHLFAALAAQQHKQARFIETRYLSILEQPLVSSGTLAFDAPDRLVKQTLKPIRETFALAGGVLTVERPDEDMRRRFDVQADPVLWAFVEAFRATLAGDLAGLERFYRVAFDGTAEGWRLRLTPLPREMHQRVEAIVIDGTGVQIGQIEIQETSGDRSVMTITPER